MSAYIPRRVLGFVGFLGGGKTLLMTIFEYMFSLEGTKVLTNYKTTFSETIAPTDLLEFKPKNCVLGIDEIGTLIDSRINSKANRYISYFGLQSRKRHVFILWTSQFAGLFDKRFRFISNWVFLCQRTGTETNSEGRNITDFAFTLMYRGIPIKQPLVMKYEDSIQFFELYDTDEPIYPIDMLREGVIDWNKTLRFYDNSPTKNSFVVLMRRDYPFVNKEDLRAVYELLSIENFEYAKRVLGVEMFKGEMIDSEQM